MSNELIGGGYRVMSRSLLNRMLGALRLIPIETNTGEYHCHSDHPSHSYLCTAVFKM